MTSPDEIMDVEEVKTVKDCIEYATMDAYGDDEQVEGWVCCLEEVLSGVKRVRVMGVEVPLKGIESNGRTVIAICEQNQIRARVTLDSIMLIKPSKAQSLWLRAWKKWFV